MLRELLDNTDTDVIALQELNQFWQNVPFNQHPQERTKRWIKTSKLTHTYNTHDADALGSFVTQQYGGVAVLGRQDAAPRTIGSGTDDTGLGRWCYQRLQGKTMVTTRIYSAYRPCSSWQESGSVHNQHLRYLRSNKDLRSPQTAFLEDFKKELLQAKAEGDQIIIGADFNLNLETDALNDWLDELEIEECIIERHGKGSPATHLRGSTKVDGMFLSRTLQVTGCGYLPNGRTIGDHLILWVDVTYVSMLGHTSPKFLSKDARRLQLYDPRIVERYLNIATREVETNNLINRAHNQRIAAEQIPHQVDQEEFTQIIIDLRQVMDKAEHKCRKFRTGNVPFSECFTRSVKTVAYWRLVVKKKFGKRIDEKYLRRLEEIRTDNIAEHYSQISRHRAIKILKLVEKDYRAIKRQGSQKRITWMENLAKAIADKSGKEEASVLIDIINREAMRDMHRSINTTKPSKKGKMISTVEAPPLDDPSGDWIQHDDKAHVESAVLQHLDRHFRQSYSTPLLQPEAIAEFGHFAETPASDAILRGDYTGSDTTDPFLLDMLPHLKRPETIEELPSHVSWQEIQQTWKFCKEKTSSSPYNQHFGHFKAFSTNKKLAKLLADIVSIPLMSGMSPEQYQMMIVCLLEKKKDVIRVDKLRLIFLLDALFSCSCRILARRSALQAEKHNLIAFEQFGSRKRKDALLLSIQFRISMDITTQLRQPLSVVCNDLASCYDRIIHTIACLAHRRAGHSKGTVYCRFFTTQQLEVFLRSAHGDSDLSTKTGTWLVPTNQPIHGVLQGSPDGPITWALVSTPVLEAMRDMGYVMAFKCALSGEIAEIVGCMFVDDANYLQSDVSNKVETVVRKTQESQTYLRGLINSTGGALNPAKSFFWLIDFKWTNGVWKFSTNKQQPAEIQVADQHNNMIALPRYETNQAQRVLGVTMCPNDDGKQQTAILRKKGEDWAAHVEKRKINPSHAWVGLWSGIVKGVSWPLPATTLSVQQCNSIMAPILRVGLRSATIQSKICRKIVYGSTDVQGLQGINIYTDAGTQRIKHLIHHGHKKDQLGVGIRATFQQLQLEIGVPGNLFDWNHNDWKHITTKTWISHVWKFCSDAQFRLLPIGPTLELRRENDIFLMEYFGRTGIKGKRLKSLQRCRLYKQASTLADIASADGQKIRPEALSGAAEILFPTTYNWPAQQKPCRSDWIDWHKALAPLMVTDGSLDLLQPLGRWIDKTKQDWEWFHAPTENRLYQHSSTGWSFYIHLGMASRPNAGYYDGPHECQEPTSTRLNRAHTTPIGKYIRCLGSAPDIPKPPALHPSSFSQFLDQSTQNVQFLLSHAPIPEMTVYRLGIAILQGTAKLVSDGSFRPDSLVATYEVRLEDRNQQHQIIFTQYVPGNLADNDAYRAEAAGILAGLELIHAISTYCNLPSGKVLMGCDGQSALSMAFNHTWEIRTTDQHHDIMSCIHHRRDSLPITIQPHWIPSHQKEKGIPYHRMDRMAQLNHDCDLGAKGLSKIIPTDTTFRLDLPIWALEINHKPVVNNIPTAVSKAIHDGPLLHYWNEKGRLDQSANTLVDWAPLASAMRNATITRRRFVTKSYSENCATGEKMLLWKYRDTAKCARCGFEVENFPHVVCCQHLNSKLKWATSLRDLDTWMNEQQTLPRLRKSLIQHLRRWHTGSDLAGIPPALEQAFLEQEHIGWYNFLFGYVSQEWQRLQQAHYQYLGLQKTGKRWVTALIEKLWQVIWNQWDDRNKTLHNKKKILEYYDTSELDQEVRTEYFKGIPPRCPRKDRRYFKKRSLSHLLNLPTVKKRLWLSTIQKIRNAVPVPVRNFNAERRLIRLWLIQMPDPEQLLNH